MRRLNEITGMEITSAVELIAPTLQAMEVIKSADKGCKQFDEMGLVGKKSKRQLIIGSYLITTVKNTLEQDWIVNNTFLKTAVEVFLQEEGKKETAEYIATRTEEYALFSCQTASKIDPLSAPKIDPPLPFKLNSIGVINYAF